MTPMISALVLSILLVCAFSFMMFQRRRILRAIASPASARFGLSDSSGQFGSLKSFDERVAAAIRDAGSDERHLNEMSCDFTLSVLWKISHNARELMEEAGELREKTWAQVARGLAKEESPISDSVSYITDLHRGLLRVNSSRAKRMLFSAIEISIGKIVHHSHYHYTYSVAAKYCAEVDIVETMADIVDEPTARLLRTHLS
ncbi:MAG TPA: hypothetical protein VK638_44960 [Edaphobacter sp.]|nr:hypothetical protein [Edaphobacter sp.]